MRNVENEIMERLKAGPVLRTKFLLGKRANFKRVYSRLLSEGKITQSGTGAKRNPKYVGLPGAQFPAPRPKVQRVRVADIKVMTDAGYTREAAIRMLSAVNTDFQAYINVLQRAREVGDKHRYSPVVRVKMHDGLMDLIRNENISIYELVLHAILEYFERRKQQLAQ